MKRKSEYRTSCDGSIHYTKRPYLHDQIVHIDGRSYTFKKCWPHWSRQYLKFIESEKASVSSLSDPLQELLASMMPESDIVDSVLALCEHHEQRKESIYSLSFNCLKFVCMDREIFCMKLDSVNSMTKSSFASDLLFDWTSLSSGKFFTTTV